MEIHHKSRIVCDRCIINSWKSQTHVSIKMSYALPGRPRDIAILFLMYAELSWGKIKLYISIIFVSKFVKQLLYFTVLVNRSLLMLDINCKLPISR